MNLPFAGILESAIIGGIAGGLGALVAALFAKKKPCPECKQPLPMPLFAPLKKCPKCGCRLNKKGEKLDDKDAY